MIRNRLFIQRLYPRRHRPIPIAYFLAVNLSHWRLRPKRAR
jgi:hypothetical protein